MIEIPECLTLARQLNDTVMGKTIAKAEVAHTPHSFTWYSGDSTMYAQEMEGQRFGEATGIGCMVEIQVGKNSLIINDGTNIRYLEPGTKLPSRYQALIMFDDDSSLLFTVQMYGGIFLENPATYDNPYYRVGKEKPMPGTPDFDYAYFSSLREDLPGNTSMKAFLATQQRIPGLGNGVLQDILLEAGLHPKRKMNTLRESDWKHTYEAVTGTLEQMTLSGGRDVEKNIFGEPGGYRTKLSKKTFGGSCPYCGNPIMKMNYLGGTVYYCQHCQQ